MVHQHGQRQRDERVEVSVRGESAATEGVCLRVVLRHLQQRQVPRHWLRRQKGHPLRGIIHHKYYFLF